MRSRWVGAASCAATFVAPFAAPFVATFVAKFAAPFAAKFVAKFAARFAAVFAALLTAGPLVACGDLRGSDEPATLPDGILVEEVVVITTDDTVALAGSLLRARHDASTQRRAAVVLIGGSGPQDRDGTRAELPGYRPLRDIAEVIAARGVSVLRLDDRGVGESGGDPSTATTRRQQQDVHSAVAWLRARADIDGSRIGLVGHSEGGLVALMHAAADTTIETLVLLATPSRTGREVARWQRAWLAARDVGRFPTETHRRVLQAAEEAAEREAARDAWMREWFDLDPRAFAASVQSRVLIVHGERDRQVPVAQSAELHAVLSRGAGTVVLRRFPDIDHLLLADPDGDPSGYVRLADRRVSRAVLETIAEWVAPRS